jgi:hypothetical protein
MSPAGVTLTGKHGTGDLQLHRCPAITNPCKSCGAKVRVLALDDESVSTTTRIVIEDKPDKGGTYIINDEGFVVHDLDRDFDTLRYRRHWHRIARGPQAASGQGEAGDAHGPTARQTRNARRKAAKAGQNYTSFAGR